MRNGKKTTIGFLLLILLSATSCGTSGSSGDTRGTLGEEGSLNSTANDTTVQSSGGSLSCSVSISSPVTSGAAATATLTVTGAEGPITVEGTSISGVSDTTTEFTLNLTFTTSSSGPVTVHPSVTVSDTHNTATCTYSVTIN